MNLKIFRASKNGFFNDRIFIFTPKGDVMDLPEDSSPIDFAYSIHSDIGDHIFGAKINGKIVSNSFKLKNGDIVEIITKKSSSFFQMAGIFKNDCCKKTYKILFRKK